jgi:pimeloyl-ACP methyl ester carboxylesterase
MGHSGADRATTARVIVTGRGGSPQPRPVPIRPRLVVGGPGIVLPMSTYDVERSSGIHVVHDGPRQALPMLLVHGSGFSGVSWSPVVPVLAGPHHIIRVDLPGHGQSPPAPSYDVPAQAGRLAAVLDELGLRPVTVVGHSSGGYMATALAEQRPDLVGSLALISSGPSPDALLPQPLTTWSPRYGASPTARSRRCCAGTPRTSRRGACPSASPPSTSRCW